MRQGRRAKRETKSLLKELKLKSCPQCKNSHCVAVTALHIDNCTRLASLQVSFICWMFL